MRAKKPRVSARGAAWSDGDAAVERGRAAKELKPGYVRLAVFVGGGLDALDHYNGASAEERAELDAAFALGGHTAVVELVKGKLPMIFIHRLIDRAEARFGIRTHHFEAAHRVLFEVFLLALCAVPGVSGWRSALAALLVNALRLRAAETGRRKASILGRAKEAGLVVDPDLAPYKLAQLREIEEEEAWHTWAWPGLAMVVAAAEMRSFTAALVLGAGATLARAWYDKRALPAWRRSRLAWKARRDGLPEFVVYDPTKGYLQVCWGSAGLVDVTADATRMTYDDALELWATWAQMLPDAEVRHVAP